MAIPHNGRRIRPDHGDTAMHLVDGRDILGSEHAHLLYDGIHPDAEGYQHMARALDAALRDLDITIPAGAG
jgi:lysophospholipase L1-like esterase